jgi:hypothetical protein
MISLPQLILIIEGLLYSGSERDEVAQSGSRPTMCVLWNSVIANHHTALIWKLQHVIADSLAINALE